MAAQPSRQPLPSQSEAYGQFQQSQRYIVTRQSELSLLPTYTPGVSESYVDRWRLVVSPLSFSKDRMQFSWRSPGIQTIMSNNVNRLRKY